MGEITKHLLIRGMVQGVGFRYSMVDQAESLGVVGWVRNCPDGSVEAMVQGEATQVEAIVAWVKKGPTAARIKSVDVSEGFGHFDDFSIAY